jgi:hypothetical protein
LTTSGFNIGFASGSFGPSVSNFGRGFSLAAISSVSGTPAVSLFNNINTYIVDGTRVLHGTSAGAGSPARSGVVTRSNVTRTVVLKVIDNITVKGFKFVRVPEPLGNWNALTDDCDAVLTVKSGGSINGGAISTKTFATNSKFRTTSSGRISTTSVNDFRTDYDLITVYDTSSVTLTAGTYNLVFRGIQSQIGLAHFWTANIPIPTTDTVYPDPTDAANTTSYPVIQVMSEAP